MPMSAPGEISSPGQGFDFNAQPIAGGARHAWISASGIRLLPSGDRMVTGIHLTPGRADADQDGDIDAGDLKWLVDFLVGSGAP
ncbi:MAG: hypothetical protein HUU25_11865 [Candidatus Sumerlaeia bacterium]|nr:hypothetical protein [Candidatus Sumerlaeia bacterium]